MPELDDATTLGALVQEAITGVTPLATSRDVSLSVSIRNEDALITSAPDALQILTNLLLNAISFTPSGKGVLLSAHTDREGLVAAVQDDGPGVPPDRRDSIFARGKSTRSGGAGIGLVHALAMARHHGGDLKLSPHVDGEGARFELSWPSRIPRRSSAPPPVPTSKRLDGARVLVIEDDPMLVVLLEAALTARGA
ncbi:MAG: HAMP domain-containing sensor histidine kinase, partial [Polyangiaceae bacterium]